MKTPMNLSDLERLVTEYTSQDHSSQGFNIESSEFDYEWEVNKLNWYFYFAKEESSMFVADFRVVRDYAHFCLDFPYYAGSKFGLGDSNILESLGVNYSFRNSWMRLGAVITEDMNLHKFFDVLFSVLKKYN